MKRITNLIAIDGPNGVGKSTIIELLKGYSEDLKLNWIFTKEPTNSLLGNFIRQNQNLYHAQTLAALVAANRYEHLESLIKPSLKEGKTVITDRYVASSFVYQVLDGLTSKFVQYLNAEILLPELYFILTASERTIAKRVSSRSHLTRFETGDTSKQETDLFMMAGKNLKEHGVEVHFVDNDSASSEEVARTIMQKIMRYVQG